MRLCRMKAQRSSKDSFRAQYSNDPRVAFDGLPQGPRRRFKGAFQNVVRVTAAQTVDMQILHKPDRIARTDRSRRDIRPHPSERRLRRTA